MGVYVSLPRPEGVDPFMPSTDETTAQAVCFLGIDEDGGPRFQAHQVNEWAIQAVADEMIVPDGEGVLVGCIDDWQFASRGDFILRDGAGNLSILTDAEMDEHWEYI